MVKLLLCLTAAALLPARAADAAHRNALPPRLQWEANGGYCGEVSLISAGLYYGQYLSQFDARVCAIGNRPQTSGELLLGLNARRAAAKMHLQSAAWPGGAQDGPASFLRWVRRQVLRGRPVAIGVFNNEFLLYGKTNPQAGDPQYDHIVPVSRVSGRRLTFSDNGLWGRPGHHPYFFTYPFAAFPAGRALANAPAGPLYSLPATGGNFGLAITGVADRDGDTLPVRVETDRNFESPALRHGSNRRPAPRPLVLKIIVSGLTPGIDYKLYRYDRLDAIPDSRFNARAASAAQSRDLRLASGTRCVLTQKILSDEVAAYRCVEASAP